jgi:hypothetical protein
VPAIADRNSCPSEIIACLGAIRRYLRKIHESFAHRIESAQRTTLQEMKVVPHASIVDHCTFSVDGMKADQYLLAVSSVHRLGHLRERRRFLPRFLSVNGSVVRISGGFSMGRTSDRNGRALATCEIFREG